MKKKYIGTAGLALLLLVVFLPVFYAVIVYGANLNYNELHKIITAVGNRRLLFCAVIGACLLGMVYFLQERFPIQNVPPLYLSWGRWYSVWHFILSI